MQKTAKNRRQVLAIWGIEVEHPPGGMVWNGLECVDNERGRMTDGRREKENLNHGGSM